MKKILFFYFLTVLSFMSNESPAQWLQTQGPSGGRIGCIAVSGTNLFACSGAGLFEGTNGGVFLSTNNGLNWTTVNSGLTDLNVITIIAVPNGTGGTNLFVGTGGGNVFLSTNNGSSWTELGLVDGGWPITSLAANGMVLFAGSYGNGVFRSTDNGISWENMGDGINSVMSLIVNQDGKGGTSIFAGTDGIGVFRSTNNGLNWTEVNTGLTNMWIYALAASSANLFAGTINEGVFLSTNNGETWAEANSGLTNYWIHALIADNERVFTGTEDGIFLSTNNGTSWTPVNSGLTNTYTVALSIQGANLYAGTLGSGVFLSTNSGNSWIGASSGIANTNIKALAVSPNGISGTNIFAGTANGIFRSTNNGASWTDANFGLTRKDVRSLTTTSNGTGGTNIVAGTFGGVFLSTNNGSAWININHPAMEGFIFESVAGNGSTIFAGCEVGVFRSTDNGATWEWKGAGSNIVSVAFYGTNIFASSWDLFGGGVFRSTDNGESWTDVNTGLTNIFVKSFTTVPGERGETSLFAGTFGGGVFRSTNNGASWTEVNNGLTSMDIKSFAVNETNLFAGTGEGIFLTTNNGAIWEQVNESLLNTDVQAIAISGSDLIAGTFGSGAWRRPLSEMVLPVELVSFIASVDKKDVHLSWVTVNEINNSGFDIERLNVNSEMPGEWTKIAFVSGNGTTNESRNYSFADKGLNTGSYNYRLKQIDYNGNFEYFNLANEVMIGVPEKYDISQNYPNPFNPVTKINFDLPFDSKVAIKVFDITGREIATLVNDVQPAGYYTVTFDAMNIASGMYFYRITAEGGSQQYMMTKKMMVVK